MWFGSKTHHQPSVMLQNISSLASLSISGFQSIHLLFLCVMNKLSEWHCLETWNRAPTSVWLAFMWIFQFPIFQVKVSYIPVFYAKRLIDTLQNLNISLYLVLPLTLSQLISRESLMYSCNMRGGYKFGGGGNSWKRDLIWHLIVGRIMILRLS